METASKRKNCDPGGRSPFPTICISVLRQVLLVEMWKSLLNHVADIHEGHGSLFPRCQNGPLEDDREWIKKGKGLKTLIYNTVLVLISPHAQVSALNSANPRPTCWYFIPPVLSLVYLLRY